MLTPQMISAGCALAAYGEVHFELSGFLCQCAAIAFEASRLVMIQILLHGLKMDPIVSLHYYAPVCAGINMLILPFTEGLEPFYALHRVGLLVLFSNAGIAFALNVAAVFLISVGSGLILTLAGVAKDILLISGSVVAFGSRITFLQVLGYSQVLPLHLGVSARWSGSVAQRAGHDGINMTTVGGTDRRCRVSEPEVMSAASKQRKAHGGGRKETLSGS